MSDPEPHDAEAEAGGDFEDDTDEDPAEPVALQSDVGRDTARTEDHAAMAALVARIVRQDESALAELYRQLASRVFHQVSRIVRDLGTVEEVVEDVFWQVWRQAPRFDATRGVVVAWVMQMSRSRALDALRACGRNPLHTALDIDDAMHVPVAEDADPLGRLVQAHLGEQVQRALALLDPLRRQLVSLAFERGYSQSEIAEHMGLPLGTVKSHIRRALTTMKTTLEGSLVAPERRA